MANVKKTTDTQSQAVEQGQVDNTKIMEMLQSIQTQLNQVTIEKEKAIAEKLELEKQIKESNTSKDLNDPNRPIKIRSVYDGEWITLITDTGEVTLYKSNPRATVRQDKLEEILRRNIGHFLKGRVAIDDVAFIESHPELSGVYSERVDENTLKTIHTLDTKSLVDVYNNSNLNFKKSIIDAFIKGFIKGEDITFRDTAKIKALSEVMDGDLMEMINGVQENDSLVELYSK